MVICLVFIEGIMTNADKCKQLTYHAIPSGQCLLGSKFILQHDNDPQHTVKKIKLLVFSE